jgi:hypothetical protein
MRHVCRLSGLKYFPEKDEAIKELAKALLDAKSEAVAEGVVDSFSQHAVECPKPVELRRAVWEINMQIPDTKPKCTACDGTGWLISYFLITHERGFKRRERLVFTDSVSYSHYLDQMRKNPRPEGSPHQEVLSGAEPCPCTPRQAPVEDQRSKRGGGMRRAG